MKLARCLLYGLFLASAAYAEDEKVSITTYYPSPVGVYNQLQTRFMAVGDTNGDTRMDIGDIPSNPGDLWVAGNVGIKKIPNVNYELDVAGTIHADGGDVAEYIGIAGEVLPGDVVSVSETGSGVVVRSQKEYDTLVAGVIAENPGLMIGTRNNESDQPLALIGQVSCRATAENGPIKSGDLLTTSSKPGYAMKLTLIEYSNAKDIKELKKQIKENERRHAAVFATALQPLEKGEGMIRVLVRR